MAHKNTYYQFSAEKNQQLIKQRNISFEEIIAAIDGGKILDILEHYNSARYGNQYIYVVNINEYAYLVPFVKKSQSEIFLKTAFPSRKLTRQYLGKKEGR